MFKFLNSIFAVLACSVAAPFLRNSTLFILLIAAFVLIVILYHHRLQKKKKAEILFFFGLIFLISLTLRELLMGYLAGFIGVVGSALIFSVSSGETPNSSGGGVPGASSSPANSTSHSFSIDVLLEPWPTPTVEESSETGTSVNQPAAGPVPPGNAVASTEEAASPARQDPFPYQPDEVIGGDSVHAIERRLLAGNPLPSYFELELARIDAQDLFEVKVDIIKTMAVLDPTGDWMGRGARALENPRTATGEDSLEKLFAIRDDLTRRGENSDYFNKLKEKVFLRADDGDEHSAT